MHILINEKVRTRNRKFKFATVFLQLLFIATLILLPKKIFAAQNVIFDEVNWAGSSISGADEWIELKNTSDQTVDLTGWQITAWKESSQTEEVIATLSNSITPNGVFLISNNAKDHNFTNGESVLSIDPNLIDSTISLSNSNLQLKLYQDGFAPDKTPVDVMGNKTAQNILVHHVFTQFPMAALKRAGIARIIRSI